jgi:hypothetical protein
MISLLAAIHAAAGGAAPSPDGGPPPPSIRDIAPPVEVPLPLWLVILAWVAAIAVVGLAGWLVVRAIRRRPAPPPPTPRALALRALERLQARLHELDPHAFGIEVSDVLRHFVGEHYGLRAERQTSPEFLASIQHSPAFSEGDRSLLASFLERSDMVKFGRLEETESTSKALLGSAFDFVRGVNL